jgi:hypothetical protein
MTLVLHQFVIGEIITKYGSGDEAVTECMPLIFRRLVVKRIVPGRDLERGCDEVDCHK